MKTIQKYLRSIYKTLLLLCIMLSSLFCMPLKAQNPGEIVTEQSISKKGEKHYFYAVPIPDNIFSMMKEKHTRRIVLCQEASCAICAACTPTRKAGASWEKWWSTKP